ncbi:MAG: selenide, water dikinase SelD [Proteobacteria bacterium]|nr:selenide, water dikinase SelD [Pseudomonadota bacterium]
MTHSDVRLDLVLVGGGHAHVQVLRRFMMRPEPGVRLTLVVDRTAAVYSGMVPGFVAGDYRADEVEIDVLPLARRAGARVIAAAATRIDPAERRIQLVGRPAIAYDVASVDVGSSVQGLELPGVREHALCTRPIGEFVDAAEARFEAAGKGPARVVVVGGGAAGVELACTLQARLRRVAGAAPQVTLVSADRGLLPGARPRVVRALERELETRDIAVRVDSRVVAVAPDGVELATGEELASDCVVWATGAAPPALLGASTLPLDAAGYVRVDAQLRVEGLSNLFAVGDCAHFAPAAGLPKAGVYAVRQGPVLDHNLRAQLRGRRLRSYRPQRDFLSLLNLGDRRALGAKWGWTLRGRVAWRLKDFIDRRFMRRFRVLDAEGRPAPEFPSAEAMGMEEMECGGCAAKVAASPLSRALSRLPAAEPDESVLLGLDAPDDAAAWQGEAGDVVLATVDAFRAFADDPWLVGRAAAVNALSDVVATGGVARFALALVTVPEAGAFQTEEMLAQTLAGIRAGLDPAGVSLVGGHSTVGPELFVGLAVWGRAETREALWALGGLRAGDALLLSKPLGTGVLLAADMQGRLPGRHWGPLVASLVRDNRAAGDVARRFDAGACTDVSGFGLAGHLGEMLRASGLAADLELEALPVLPGAQQLLETGVRSTFHAANAASRRELGLGDDVASSPRLELLFDPQTSGGLLFGVAGDRAEAALAALRAGGDERAACVGRVRASGPPRLWVTREGAADVAC